jgi:hypothetical protein
MAHSSNLEIPARFSFRPYNAHWEICWAEVVGWGEEPHGLRALMSLAKAGHPIISSDYIPVRVNIPIPDSTSNSSLGMLYGLRNEIAYEITMNRRDIPYGVIKPREDMDNSPYISGRDAFPVLAYCNSAFAKSLMIPKVKPGEKEKNAWVMREEFLNLDDDLISLLRFLNRWGMWDFYPGYNAGTLNADPLPFVLEFPHLLLRQRDNFRRALAGSSTTWLKQDNSLSFSPMDKAPYFLVKRSYCKETITATITIDHLRKAKFGICKLPDCGKLFQHKTQQKKLYCKTEHAHLANVRKLRADAKLAKSKGRKNAKG